MVLFSRLQHQSSASFQVAYQYNPHETMPQQNFHFLSLKNVQSNLYLIFSHFQTNHH